MGSDKKFIRAIFCAPTGEWNEFPSRLGDSVFEELEKIGINRIIAFGLDERRETVEETLRQCERFGMGYLACVRSAREYTRIFKDEKGEPAWCERSDGQKAELDERFIAEVAEYTKYPAFCGIFFTDESGYLAFDGIAHAKKVFDEHYKGFEFHTNFFSYSINEDIFWGGMQMHGKEAASLELELPFKLCGELEVKFENRFNFYDRLVEGLLSKADFEFISQDRYPFGLTWESVPTSVHIALFELNAFLKRKSTEHGNKAYNYMQVGQEWDCSREMTFAEMALQLNMTAAYGNVGFAYFPGVFPLDWRYNENSERTKNGGCGLIDLYGRPTVYAEYAARVDKFLSRFEEDILSSKFLGISAYGEYDNGFDKAMAKSLYDGECIYVGDFPDILHYRDERITVNLSNQMALSVFERDGKRRYYAVNLSTVYDNYTELGLPSGRYTVYSNREIFETDGNMAYRIDAGCGLYIIEQ